MIKGCSKRVIVMKDTGNDMFEQAFFILKPEASVGMKGFYSEGDILKQANLILDAQGFDSPLSGIKLNVNSKNKKRFMLTPFLWGFVLGIASACLLIVLTM